MSNFNHNSVDAALHECIAHGEAVIAECTPVLRHLLVIDDPMLFSDRVVAHSRGMLTHIAHQLIGSMDTIPSDKNELSRYLEDVESLYNALMKDSELLACVHAEALEWQLADRLELQLGLDPVMPPLVQELVRSANTELAQLAKEVQAVQANGAQMARRMEMPLKELPAEIFHKVLMIFERKHRGTQQAHKVVQLCETLRKSYAERKRRVNKIARLLVLLGSRLREALSIEKAGVAIFATALAAASGEDRERVIYSFSESQASRLGLTMRAAGFGEEQIRQQIACLYPGLVVRMPYHTIASYKARDLLGQAHLVSEAE